jgi:hypothetical protein
MEGMVLFDADVIRAADVAPLRLRCCGGLCGSDGS